MRIKINNLVIQARESTEHCDFTEAITFIFGPVSTGKSTVARLIDYCLGGKLERTPAIQKEFLSAKLTLELGSYECVLERGAHDTQAVRVTWSDGMEDIGSTNAPLTATGKPVVFDGVFNLSDLLFHLSGVEPIKVRQRSRDPESPMIRLSFRDVWRYCYLDQAHLDSSCFRLEDPFRGRKSQDAMRFFTGLHSERLSQLEVDLYRTIDDQHGKREAVEQIRQFMDRFSLGSELDVAGQLQETKRELREAEAKRELLEQNRIVTVHPTDPLRAQLRQLGEQMAGLQTAAADSESMIDEQKALRAELMTAKIKSGRVEQAGSVLSKVDYKRCPQCGTCIESRQRIESTCYLCCSDVAEDTPSTSIELEAARREINDRIDQITDSINRRKLALEKTHRKLGHVRQTKSELDRQLQIELSRYDSAYVESIRTIDRLIATLVERAKTIKRLEEMPRAISDLLEEAGGLQGKIDRLRKDIQDERIQLRVGNENAKAIARRFKEIMLAVQFPGVSADDEVVLDPKNWKPLVVHGDQEWGFWDAGSGGKKTLFNVCYALAIHEVAQERGMPVPSILVIDSPTKNISEDENPELVQSLYREIYRFASEGTAHRTQFLLIDSDIVCPEKDIAGFSQRRMAGDDEAPRLISYYDGP